MSAQFRAAREVSTEPVFKLVGDGEVTHGCKAIIITEAAVFIHVSGFLWCGAFWMPITTYNTLKDGYINSANGVKTNYNNTIYQY